MTEDEREFREFQEWKARKGKTQTIEQTGKGWKAATLIGGLLMLVGIVGTCAGIGNASQTGSAASMNPTFPIIMVVGLLTTVTARLGAWWYHG